MNTKTKSYLRKITILLTLVSVVFLSVGCNPPDPKQAKVTLKMWKPFVDSDKMNVLISMYKKENPNVTIEYTKKNIENYEGDILNSLAADSGPDIFSINSTWLPLYLDKVEPAPSATFSLKDYKDSYVDVVYNDLVRDGKIYGTALWVDSLGLYYNKDLLGTAGIATPPKTWNELERDVRAIGRQDESGYFYQSGVAMGTYQNVNRAVDIVYLLMLQAGVIPWSQDGRSPQFSSTVNKGGQTINPGVEGVEFYTSFANPSSPNYNWNSESDYSIDAFANGRAAFLYGYSYTRDQIDAKAANLNYDVAPVPQYNLNDPSVNYSSYFAEVVSKKSAHKQEAWDFLKFISSKQALDAYYAKDKEPSSRRDLIEKQTQDLDIGVFAHANLTAKSFYKFDEAKFDKIFGDMIERIIFNGDKVQSALSRAQSQAAAIVSQRLF